MLERRTGPVGEKILRVDFPTPSFPESACNRAMNEVDLQVKDLLGGIAELRVRLATVLNATGSTACQKHCDGPSAARVDSPLVQRIDGITAQIADARAMLADISSCLDV